MDVLLRSDSGVPEQRLSERLLASHFMNDAGCEPFGDQASFAGAEKIESIARGQYRGKTEAEISGSGYVVESLEAAMWCFVRTESFKEAILLAVNLGGDTDTTAAVCGQVAGAHYGASGIPRAWTERLALREKIEDLADALYERQNQMS